METINETNTIYHSFHFTFPGVSSRIYITKNIPSLEDICGKMKDNSRNILFVCDENTHYIAKQICGNNELPISVLPAGEEFKRWDSVETILKKAKDSGLGRDSLFVGIGGGVVTDMAAFAASIYMRGVKLSLISTSLLGMVDAAAGGKTGFDLFDIKNLAGTFYPADNIFMPLEALITLPSKEWKSGMAELIKTAIIGDRKMLDDLLEHRDTINGEGIAKNPKRIAGFIAKSVEIKCHIVENDPQEKGDQRMLLNLGHTFGHALESSLGLGSISHGEAVAWGLVRSCELGLALGITNKVLCDQIIEVLKSFNFEIRAPYPEMHDTEIFMNALMNDKKKKGGGLNFIVPDASGACIVNSNNISISLLKDIIGNA
ncbi:MAG: 3-dehydroquinate synthase [Treponema sp.]|jgi:3-dehydroquinate synthase|nr:3-dehydroquinate synthase [Treponema sp.]